MWKYLWLAGCLSVIGCVKSNAKLLADGGVDLAGADLFGVDLAGADLTGADLAGADLAMADLAAPIDLRSPDDLTFVNVDFSGPSCSHGPSSAAFATTNFAGGVFTLTVPTGSHASGDVTLAGATPAGATVSSSDSTVRLFDAAGHRYEAVVTDGPSGSSFHYDAVVPPGTYELDWLFVLQMAGPVFIATSGSIASVVVDDCSIFKNVTVPAIGPFTLSTVTVNGLDVFTDADSLDVTVSFRAGTVQVQASVTGLFSPSTSGPITIVVPNGTLTPIVQISGQGTFGSSSYNTTMQLATKPGGQSSYTLNIPALSKLEGVLPVPLGSLDTGGTTLLECDSANDTQNSSTIFISTATDPYVGFQPRNTPCTPYFIYPLALVSTFTNSNENMDVSLFGPNPANAPSVTLTRPTPSPFPSPPPQPVPAPTSTLTVLGQLNDAAGSPLANYKVRVASTSLLAPFAADQAELNATLSPFGQDVFTDNLGQFKLHLLPGNYDVTVRQ